MTTKKQANKTQAAARKGRASTMTGRTPQKRVSTHDGVHHTGARAGSSLPGMDERPTHCIRCGRSRDQVEFRSDLALKCVECDEDTSEERKEYHRAYHKARGRAIKDLVEKHPEEFEKLLLKHRRALFAEAAANSG